MGLAVTFSSALGALRRGIAWGASRRDTLGKGLGFSDPGVIVSALP